VVLNSGRIVDNPEVARIWDAIASWSWERKSLMVGGGGARCLKSETWGTQVLKQSMGLLLRLAEAEYGVRRVRLFEGGDFFGR
jgi:hypothetical protein